MIKFKSFINKYNKLFLCIFILLFLISLLLSVSFYEMIHLNTTYYLPAEYSFANYSISAFAFKANALQDYSRYYGDNFYSDISFEEYFEPMLNYYILSIVAFVILILMISICIVLLVLYCKKHKIYKSLLTLPLFLTFIWEVAFLIVFDTEPWVSFYIQLILVVSAIIYGIIYLITRQRKPTKDERISELEKQLAELKDTQVIVVKE